MSFVYRYTDMSDGIIKYVGIVWSDRKTLKQRIAEHLREERFKGVNWKVEYIDEDIKTRTDAECLEAHFIALYKTYKYLNSSKSGWGICSFAKDDYEWVEYGSSVNRKNKKIKVSISVGDMFAIAVKKSGIHELFEK